MHLNDKVDAVITHTAISVRQIITNILCITATGPPAVPVVNVVTTPNSAVITWIVPIITFDRENYTLEYGNDTGILDTIEMMGNANFTTVNESFFITLHDLMPFTEYYYKLTAINSNGTTVTGPDTFTTNESGMLL